MKLCRFRYHGQIRCGVYTPQRILPVDDLASVAGEKYLADMLLGGELERLFPCDAAIWRSMIDLIDQMHSSSRFLTDMWIDRSEVELLPPIARPPKLLLLAGNYAAHIVEQGGIASERDKTFPYVFMKPPTTTLVGDCTRVEIPVVSPAKIDHEVELAVVIGRKARNISRAEALEYVAGYTIINDLSDRGFTPNSNREERPKDKFFDWLHGKWHDGFCPCGPCLVTRDEIADPQKLNLRLTVDNDVRQAGSTSEQVFSVAEVIEFLASWMTLEPGDIISTGTPAGVGNASGRFLAAGQTMVASIDGIGQLVTKLVSAD